jgi:hypothetical protein
LDTGAAVSLCVSLVESGAAVSISSVRSGFCGQRYGSMPAAMFTCFHPVVMQPLPASAGIFQPCVPVGHGVAKAGQPFYYFAQYDAMAIRARGCSNVAGVLGYAVARRAGPASPLSGQISFAFPALLRGCQLNHSSGQSESGQLLPVVAGSPSRNCGHCSWLHSPSRLAWQCSLSELAISAAPLSGMPDSGAAVLRSSSVIRPAKNSIHDPTLESEN